MCQSPIDGDDEVFVVEREKCRIFYVEFCCVYIFELNGMVWGSL